MLDRFRCSCLKLELALARLYNYRRVRSWREK